MAEPEVKPVVEEPTLSPQEQVDLLKANTVSKEQFDNLQQQYNTLFKAYTERPAPTQPKELTEEEVIEQDKNSYNEVCKEFSKNIGNNKANNYEIAKQLLKADDYMRKYHNKSIFESETGNSPDESKVADRSRELVEYALENCQGNADVFNTLFYSKLS